MNCTKAYWMLQESLPRCSRQGQVPSVHKTDCSSPTCRQTGRERKLIPLNATGRNSFIFNSLHHFTKYKPTGSRATKPDTDMFSRASPRVFTPTVMPQTAEVMLLGNSTVLKVVRTPNALNSHQYPNFPAPSLNAQKYIITCDSCLPAAVTVNRRWRASEIWRHQQGSCRDNAIHLFSAGARFEFRARHRLFWFRCSWFSSFSPGECRHSFTRPLPSKSFSIHHSLIILLFHTLRAS